MTEKKQMASAAQALAVDSRTAGRMLGLGRTSISNLVSRGELTPLKFGRATRYSTQEISELVARRRAEGRSASAAQMGIYRLSPGDPAA